MNVKNTSRRSFALACLTAVALASGCSTSTLPPTVANASTDTAAQAVREDASVAKGPPQTLLSVTINTPVISATRGSVASAACPMTIASNDTADAKYMVTGWGTGTVAMGAAPFPVENYPTRSYVSWSLDDAPATTLLANSGSPGQRFVASSPSSYQSHCLSLEIAVPGNLKPGTYRLSIDFHLMGGNGALLSSKAMQTGAVTVIVT
jgi:hypothetical protein